MSRMNAHRFATRFWCWLLHGFRHPWGRDYHAGHCERRDCTWCGLPQARPDAMSKWRDA